MLSMNKVLNTHSEPEAVKFDKCVTWGKSKLIRCLLIKRCHTSDSRCWAVCGPACCCVGSWFPWSHHHVSLSFLTVTSPPPAPAPLDDPLPAPDAPAAPGPGPVPAPDAAADGAPAPPLPSMVETSPCMKAQGGLLGELSSGQRSPLGQYTSPSPRRPWMYTLVQGKQNLNVVEVEKTSCYNFQWDNFSNEIKNKNHQPIILFK